MVEIIAMTTRQELYQKFGPILLETIVLIIKDEINVLRAQHGLEPRTKEQMMDSVNTKLSTLPLYDWMNEIS